jgi:hypothetical protein
MRQPFELKSSPTPIIVAASVGIAAGDREAPRGRLLGFRFDRVEHGRRIQNGAARTRQSDRERVLSCCASGRE